MPRALAHLDLTVPPASAEETDGTWRYPWPAGERMCDDLDGLIAQRGLRWQDLSVLDLGCGRGHLGLVAALRGAAVTWSDGSPTALMAVGSVARRAGLAVRAVPQEWGGAIPGAPWDLILAGDLLYRDAHLEALAATIAASLAADGEAWCSDPRCDLGPAWPLVLAAAGLAEQRQRRLAGYTLSILRRRGRDHG